MVCEPVSVIVCVLNEMAFIQKLLPELLSQQYPDFEVVVVSDRSHDELYDWLLFQSFQHQHLKVVRVNQVYDHITPKKFALTLGIKAAKYEKILLTDADCLPASPHWIAEMQSGFSIEKKIVLGISQYHFQGGLLNFFIRHETFYTAVQYVSFALAGQPYMGVGRNLAYTKSLFFKNKGFLKHQQVMGGDDDLFIKDIATAQNTAICISAAGQTFSEPKQTWQAWYNQKRRHLSVGKYYTLTHKWLLGLHSFSQVGFWLILTPLFWIEGGSMWVWAGFVLRNSLFLTVQQANIRKLQANVKGYELLFFDVLYALYYVVVGFAAFFTKKIKWN